MSYIESSLGQNEVLHYRARFHWFYHAMAWGSLIIGVLLALVTLWGESTGIAVLSLFFGVGVWLMIMVPIWTTEIGVTNQRIIYKRGFIQRDTNELQVRSIEEVRFNQDFWGRMFDFGRLEIHGTGDDAIFLPAVADPLVFRAALQDAIGAAQGGNGGGAPANGAGPQPGPELQARPA